MAIVVEFNSPDMTAAQYDSIIRDLESKEAGSPAMAACLTSPLQAQTDGLL